MSYPRQLGRFVFPALLALGVVAAPGARAEVAAPLSITTYNADANSFDERSLLMSSGGNSIDWIAPATTTADVIVLGWEE